MVNTYATAIFGCPCLKRNMLSNLYWRTCSYL